MIKRTFALAVRPIFNFSAARDTLVAVRFAVRAAHWFIVHRTNARTYATNQIHVFNAVFVARRVFLQRNRGRFLWVGSRVTKEIGVNGKEVLK